MTTMLLFDDQRLFHRHGFVRKYGEPVMLRDAVYCDPNCSASGGLPSIWQSPDGVRHLYYQAFSPEHLTWPLAAVSRDGIHWEPDNTAGETLDNPAYPNQLLPTYDAELAKVYVDTHDDPSRLLKAFVAKYDHDRLSVEDQIYVSPDGRHWTLWDKQWSDRHCEPGAGCVYSDAVQAHIVIARSGWGMRQLCVREIPDWEHPRPSIEAIQIDSLDPSDYETYGMPVFQYKGYYLGFLWMYHVPAENATHYMNGQMTSQLCYSLNGVHWQRSLREDFIGNDQPETKGMVFPSAVQVENDGTILITASATKNEHGYFKEPGGCIVTYRLRKDGFIRLCAEAEGVLCTRQLWCQGDVRWNLAAKKATVAVLDAASKPIEGFGHEDCIPFSGDSVSWSPEYREGRSIVQLTGQVVVLELKLTDGSVYAYEGDFEPLMNTEALRVERFGHR